MQGFDERNFTFSEKGELVMKKALNLIGVMMIVAISFGAAKADTLAFTTTLTGSQEVPPNVSPGIGSALLLWIPLPT